MSWFGDFKNGDGGAEPPDGDHHATLANSAILDTKNGTKIKLEWQTVDLAHYWDSWHGVEGAQGRFTRDLIRKLGIDLKAVASEDELADSIAALQDTTYLVNVKRNGDWVNTTVLERPAGVQTAIPVASPPANAPRSAIFDDDIPF